LASFRLHVKVVGTNLKLVSSFAEELDLLVIPRITLFVVAVCEITYCVSFP